MKKYLIPLIGVALLSGCYPYSPTSTQTYDLVLTNYDPSYDFQSKHTFAISDEVIKITGENFDDPDGNGEPDFVNEPYNTQILSAIKSNMTANGWTEVDKDSGPDVILLPAAMEVTNLVYYYDWYYWGWYYPGFYGGGYGWYYPGYYPPTVSSYTTGTLFISMTDPNGITPDNNVPVEWVGVVNGLLTGDVGSVATRITSNVNQLFTQSPYLKH